MREPATEIRAGRFGIWPVSAGSTNELADRSSNDAVLRPNPRHDSLYDVGERDLISAG
jgi:hypothetical protein